ncbi:triadin-like [Lolium rigidum]|uniref:triadin-like n=1 Tax=Lolium rigidum TaxID=89674 RepID=UPI001F5C10B2|nr:triadin-like [Lolium rigidum]
MEADAAAAAARGREAEIDKALRARVPFFKNQADSLTLEGVRRTLEKDMGLEIKSLDAHKKFIRQCIDKVFSEFGDENTSNASEKAEAKDDNLSKEGSEDAQSVSNKISSSADEPGARSSETEKDPEGARNQASGCDISEAMIKKAIDKRDSYFRENSETLTLVGVRRTLEEDLKLEKKALDAYKGFITKELDRVLVLQEPENGTMDVGKKEAQKDASQNTSKGSKRARQDSDTSELNDSHSEREDSDRAKRPKKRGAEKGKSIKQQKKVTVEKKLSTPKIKKVAKQDLDKSTKNKGGNSTEDNPHSSAEEDDKKRQQPAPVYGKQVERLKSIIKSCGMSIPPSVYRRAKQAPESKREAYLIKELEDILEKEGLSSHPSEKEIKAVKKRKERAKDLEGIDTSNIITSSRRRSSFIPMPVPKVEADSDDDEDEEVADDEENVEGGDKGGDAESADGSADDAGGDSD